jgi:SAM-dependent methyltransferase
MPYDPGSYERHRFTTLKGRTHRLLEERAIMRAVRSLAHEGRILDVACGTGRITALLLKEGFSVAGCDVSTSMLAVAHRRLPHVEFFRCDAARLPFNDDSFDGVTCIGLLMHMDADTRVKVLQESARVSRHRLVVQYGVKSWYSGKRPGSVRNPVVEAELHADVQRSGLSELSRFWVLRPFSSSLLLLLAKGERRAAVRASLELTDAERAHPS